MIEFRKTYTSPRCTVMWFRLNEAADFQGDEKFNYSTKAIFRGPAMEKMVTMCDMAIASHPDLEGRSNEQMPFPLYKSGEDEEGKFIQVNFKIKQTGGNKVKQWDNRPRFFDAEGNPIEPVTLGNGSVVQIGFQFDYYATLGGNVALRPKEVYVHELIEYTPPIERTEEEKAAWRKEKMAAGDSDEMPF